jgi:hypothetical protein
MQAAANVLRRNDKMSNDEAPNVILKKDHVLSRKEVIEKYPDVSPFVILKIDTQRRGVTYTEKALNSLDPAVHDFREVKDETTGKVTRVPSSLLLRDGTSLMGGKNRGSGANYVIDYVDGKLWVTDGGEFIEEAEFWAKPDFYDKVTSKGTPMRNIASARPQRINFDPYRYCHFWDNGHGCKYCSRGGNYYKNRKTARIKLDPQEASEVLREALKQKGRYTSVHFSAGSMLSGKEVFDDEIENYLEFLQAMGENFDAPRFPSQMTSSSFNERQLEIIYKNTTLATYTTDLEVLNEEKFNWICPGKAEFVGYREWKRRLIAAVDIFGKGNVCTGTVGGVELAKPEGFKTEDEALESNFAEAEDIAGYGVGVVYIVWGIGPGSAFSNQTGPSLEYYVRLAKGYHEIHQKYGLFVDNDTYRNCGNHPDTDLDRVFK